MNACVAAAAVAATATAAAATNIATRRGIDLMLHFDLLLYGNTVTPSL